jgi:uncharacterized phage-associated protein
LHLQKLVYFAHVWSLVLAGESVVADEPEAWEYGPVFESLFHQLKRNGDDPIKQYLQQFNPVSGKMGPMMPALSNAAQWLYIDQVWSRYGRFSALDLSGLASEAGGPWELARNAKVTHIEHSDIQQHFGEKLAQYRRDQVAVGSKPHLRLV